MNKLEAAYALGLEAQKRAGRIQGYWYEGITLKLGPDCRYTPDFLVILEDGEVQLHEVKGHMRDDAAVKLRVCVERYPFRIFLNGQEFTG
jgi:hypothetical protein